MIKQSGFIEICVLNGCGAGLEIILDQNLRGGPRGERFLGPQGAETFMLVVLDNLYKQPILSIKLETTLHKLFGWIL